MREDMWSDNWCVITDMGNGQALYADMSRNCQTMPLAWGKKIVSLFEQGLIREAMDHIDMIDRMWAKREAEICR